MSIAAVPRAASRLPRVAAARRPVEMMGAAAAAAVRRRGKGRDRRSAADELERQLVRALRHSEFGFRGSFERGGYLSFAALKTAFRWSARKARIDYTRPGFLRALHRPWQRR